MKNIPYKICTIKNIIVQKNELKPLLIYSIIIILVKNCTSTR